MFNFVEQARAIADMLTASGTFRTVAFIEDDRDSERLPMVMPAAFLALEKVTPAEGKPTSTSTSHVVWAVVVRSKSLMGPGGCLSLVDHVEDVLVGFKPPGEVKPLRHGGAEFYDKSNESVAYIVRFPTVAAGKSNNAHGGR